MARVTAYNTNGPLPNAGDDHDALPNEGDGEGPAHENDTVDGNKEAEKQEIEIAEKPTKKRKAKGAVVEPSGGSKPEKKLEKNLRRSQRRTIVGRSLPMGRNAKQRSRSRPRLGRNLRTRRMSVAKVLCPRHLPDATDRPQREGP